MLLINRALLAVLQSPGAAWQRVLPTAAAHLHACSTQQHHSLHTAATGASATTHHQPPHDDADDVAALQRQLLDAGLRHVKALGWSQAALVAAARELQLSPACTGMFPRGGAQLAEHWVAQANAALAAELQAAQQQYSGLPVRQRITAAVRRRLEMNQPVMDSWPQALVLLAQPRNSPAALRLLAELLDTIWYAAGDTATDSSWYSKRAALALVYSTTELYMLTDYSPGYADTWQQLERRVDDVLWLGGAAQRAAALPQQVLGGLLARLQQAVAHAPTQQQQQQQHPPVQQRRQQTPPAGESTQ